MELLLFCIIIIKLIRIKLPHMLHISKYNCFFKVYIKRLLKIILLFDYQLENVKVYYKSTKDTIYNNLEEGEFS